MVAQKFPLTYMELTEVAGNQLIHFPATFDEYWKLLEEAEYSADFYQNEIIAMSYENEAHSDITTEFSHILKTIYPKTNHAFKVHNSNRPIYVGNCEGHSVFNPDGSVVIQPSKHFEYSPGMNAETTPTLLFEVLSPSTRKYDFGTKLPCYKRIPTLQTILYIETSKPSVIVMKRQSKNQWTETELTKLEERFTIEQTSILLKDIYEGVEF